MLVAVAISAGIFIGATFFGTSPGTRQLGLSFNKYREVLGILQNEYVDTIDSEKMTEVAIVEMLARLDPHSSYIPLSDLEISNASLESDFEGVGIEFLIVADTVQVISALQGGPSDIAGIRAGDRIIVADGGSLVGSLVSNKEVFKKLRGPKGSVVQVEIVRYGMPRPMTFNIIRSRIPSQSIEASFILKPGIGYIKVSRFSDNTYVECSQQLAALKNQGAKSFILDLRDNPGGYLDRATRLANEFLSENRLMVYTEGKAKKYNQRYLTNGRGRFQTESLVVLVNEGSASAAEILAGAIQDNDRGIIVGRRTYGKGLVQVPLSLKDGSELRLTISRYYTPSGRCIQKPYKDRLDGYEKDLEERFVNGELFHQDSLPELDTAEYHTQLGRKVFGGGGILPDVFVPLDSQYTNPFLVALMQRNLFREFAISYVADHKQELDLMKKRTDARSLNLHSSAWPEFVQLVDNRRIAWPIRSQKIGTEQFILHLLKAYVARQVWGENGFYMVISQKDAVLNAALQKLGEAQKLLLASRKSNLP